jgi:rRNA-processing protein EBP2
LALILKFFATHSTNNKTRNKEHKDSKNTDIHHPSQTTANPSTCITTTPCNLNKNMAKKIKTKSTRKAKKIIEQEEPEPEEEMSFKKVTLEQIDAMSDGEEDEIEEWNAEAKALRQAISEGAFDKMNLDKVADEVDEDSQADEDEEMDDAKEEDDSSEKDDEGEDNDNKKQHPNALSGITNIKALRSVTSQLVSQKDSLPWPEKLDVIPPTPLPFGQTTEEGLIIQVHDDLKREVAFYNLALQSTFAARSQCEEMNVPFSRPEDFFAEMVKTDGTFYYGSFV